MNNLEVTSVCFTLYLCNKIWIGKPAIHISYIPLFCSTCNVFLETNCKYKWSFSLQNAPPPLPPVVFSLPLVIWIYSVQVFLVRFSSLLLSATPLKERFAKVKNITKIWHKLHRWFSKMLKRPKNYNKLLISAFSDKIQ